MAAQTSRGLGALIKKGWNEIPEIMGSSFMGLIGIGMGLGSLVLYEMKKPNVRKHKFTYVVVRSDDPRAPQNKIQ